MKPHTGCKMSPTSVEHYHVSDSSHKHFRSKKLVDRSQ